MKVIKILTKSQESVKFLKRNEIQDLKSILFFFHNRIEWGLILKISVYLISIFSTCQLCIGDSFYYTSSLLKRKNKTPHR